MKTCLFCAEEIQDAAIVCRHCGRDLQPSVPPIPSANAPSPLPTAYPPAVQARTSGLAVASLVLGIVWIWGIGAVLALIFGYSAKGEIDRSGGALSGRGMAVAGIVLGWVGCAGLLLILATEVLGAHASNTFQQINQNMP